jgi:hypothetical protein
MFRSESRKLPRGLADLLLLFTLIDDGNRLQHDGALLIGWFYRGPDLLPDITAEMQALSAASTPRYGWVPTRSLSRLKFTEPNAPRNFRPTIAARDPRSAAATVPQRARRRPAYRNRSAIRLTPNAHWRAARGKTWLSPPSHLTAASTGTTHSRTPNLRSARRWKR